MKPYLGSGADKVIWLVTASSFDVDYRLVGTASSNARHNEDLVTLMQQVPFSYPDSGVVLVTKP